GASGRRCAPGTRSPGRRNRGPWGAVKRIFKEAEVKDDTEIFGAVAARFDTALASGGFQPSRLTMAYLVRRAWRYYRRLRTRPPPVYAHPRVHAPSCYPAHTHPSGPPA